MRVCVCVCVGLCVCACVFARVLCIHNRYQERLTRSPTPARKEEPDALVVAAMPAQPHPQEGQGDKAIVGCRRRPFVAKRAELGRLAQFRFVLYVVRKMAAYSPARRYTRNAPPRNVVSEAIYRSSFQEIRPRVTTLPYLLPVIQLMGAFQMLSTDIVLEYSGRCQRMNLWPYQHQLRTNADEMVPRKCAIYDHVAEAP